MKLDIILNVLLEVALSFRDIVLKILNVKPKKEQE